MDKVDFVDNMDFVDVSAENSPCPRRPPSPLRPQQMLRNLLQRAIEVLVIARGNQLSTAQELY